MIEVPLFIICLIFIFGFIITHTKDDKDIFDVNYLIVLGHKLINDKPSDVLIERLKTTLDYLKDNPYVNIVLSGGITENNTISEAQVMKEYLIAYGISEERITLEDKSSDTIENFINCKKFIGSKKVLIISSRYHLFRSKMIARLIGMNPLVLGSKVSFFESIEHIFIEAIFVFVHYFEVKKRDI